ncbi:MAG TPA: ornithine cyclodeaminase [Gammaproteobacteria bacterium]|nr:ornithine cyclodeaminase [Gammaproteobacteria bacterium]
MVTKVLHHSDVALWVQQYGVEKCIKEVMDRLKLDYGRWSEFKRTPRQALYFPHGVIESMPISDDEWYACKLVNGHPDNPSKGLLSIYALGALLSVETGRVHLLSEMTLLTAIRTAAMSALFASLCKIKKPIKLGVIGAGAQSEFQLLGLDQVLTIDRVMVYDVDPKTVGKLTRNLGFKPWPIESLSQVEPLVESCDVIVTSTAIKQRVDVLGSASLRSDQVVIALGGDCPGKTELDVMRLIGARIVVPCIKQAGVEGEIQQLRGENDNVKEIHECLDGSWLHSSDTLRIFDSVGYALEDYAVLRWMNDHHAEASSEPFHPELDDPKNLFASIRKASE